jgi:hypothetical protein
MPAPTIADAADVDRPAPGADRPSPAGRGARSRRGTRRRLAWAAVVIALLAAMGCSGDDDDSGNDPDDDLGEQAASAEARAVAEALRAVILADGSDGAERREVESLQENVDDLPGEPDISGIADDDGDGLDDDGNLVITVDDEVACLKVADDGDVNVNGGSC